MRVKLILPALVEAQGPAWRTLKYSLFPPLGLATLAAYLDDADEVTLCDEHVEELKLNDSPDLVVIQVYITSAYRAYEIADHYRTNGAYVVMGGLHVTSCPDEAAQHADTICLGPGEDIWPVFLNDFRAGVAQPVYRSVVRDLLNQPSPRRDLFKPGAYLVPNSIVVSRGCPHKCDFCYKESFYKGGKSYYTMAVDNALEEIDWMPGKHLFFLDDNLFADKTFATELFEGLTGMNRVWQAAGTVDAVLNSGLMETAAESGLRSLFVGFESVNNGNLAEHGKQHNIGRDYREAIDTLHNLGVMVNGSFIFGMDADDESSIDSTVQWAVEAGIETSTFHILTPYPGTVLYSRMMEQGRITTTDWNKYDTRHTVFQPAKIDGDTLEECYHKAYKDFYRWSSIAKSVATKPTVKAKLRHAAYTVAWKKVEPVWDLLIRTGILQKTTVMLETVLDSIDRHSGKTDTNRNQITQTNLRDYL